jgi:hypothetical protein
MMSATTIARVFAVFLFWTAGAALPGLQSNRAALAEPATPVHPQSAAPSVISKPQHEPPRDILIRADAIRTIAENDQVAVVGPGTFSLWVDRDFLTSKLEGRTNGPRSEPVLLKVSWTGKMHLVGAATDSKRRPSARAEFQGQVTAQLADASIGCEERLIIQTTSPVPLDRVQLASQKQASGADLARHPQTQIALIRAYRNVVVLDQIEDPDNHLLLHKQRFEAARMLGYDRQTGTYHIPGKGRILLYGRAPADPATDQGPTPALIRTDITFNKEMTIQLGGPPSASAARPAPPGNALNWFRSTKIKSLDLVSSPQSLNPKSPNPCSLQIKATGDVSITCGDASLESKEGYFDLTQK